MHTLSPTLQRDRVSFRIVTRRVIFLDIDGVLAPIRQWDRYGDLELQCVQVLNEIVVGANADVVVSSTWRYGKTIAELREMPPSDNGNVLNELIELFLANALAHGPRQGTDFSQGDIMDGTCTHP